MTLLRVVNRAIQNNTKLRYVNMDFTCKLQYLHVIEFPQNTLIRAKSIIKREFILRLNNRTKIQRTYKL